MLYSLEVSKLIMKIATLEAITTCKFVIMSLKATKNQKNLMIDRVLPPLEWVNRRKQPLTFY